PPCGDRGEKREAQGEGRPRRADSRAGDQIAGSMANLWSGRFSHEPDPTAFEFGASFRFDKRLFEDDVTGSLAWVEGLAGAGVFNAEDAKAVSRALRDILERGKRDPAFVSGSDEDVHAFVERQLVERVGDL